jgi:hypothetical protein
VASKDQEGTHKVDGQLARKLNTLHAVADFLLGQQLFHRLLGQEPAKPFVFVGVADEEASIDVCFAISLQ